MGLGDHAATAAAHVLLVTTLFVSMVRLQRMASVSRQDRGVPNRWLLIAPICMVLFAFCVERMFYLAARVLIVKSEVSLWDAHPAPEMLSLVVALSANWFTPAYLSTMGKPAGTIRVRCIVEVLACIALFFALYEVFI